MFTNFYRLSSVLVFSIHGPSHVLQLMFIEHGNKEVGPTSHSVPDKIKLLRFYTGSFQSLRICTCHTNKVWSSLTLNIMRVSEFYYQAMFRVIIMITLMKASMNSRRASGGKSSGMLTSTSHPLGVCLY